MFRSTGALAVLALLLGCSPSTGGSGSPANGGSPNAGGGTGAGGGSPNAGGPSGGFDNGSGGGTLFAPDSGLIGTGGGDAGCAGVVVQGEQLPLDLYIMFDQSASMSCAIGSSDRWAAVKTALSGFVQNPGATGIAVGLGYFGTAASPPGSSCNPVDYKPDVEISPLSTSAQAIVASLNAHNPLTDTPTLPALQSAISHARAWKEQNPGHTVVVVLVTDGEPNACGSNSVTQIVDVADKGYKTDGIPTYLIGILSPGQKCTLDPNQPNQADLDLVAKAGGTNAALVIDTTNTQQDASQQFLDTMNKIRQNAQIPCEYSIPAPEQGKKLDYAKVNVRYTDPAKQKGPPVYYVETVGSCDPSTGGGWYYDVRPSDGVPTKILLCPTTCTTITAKFGYVVNVQLGCKTDLLPR